MANLNGERPMTSSDFISLTEYNRLPESEMARRAAEFLAEMKRRRSVRQFSERPVPSGVVADCVATAATAPSGANMQPWHFVVVESNDVKRRIRAAAEREERGFYQSRAPDQWLEDLAPLATGPDKPFLETAPVLIALFAERETLTQTGEMRKTYYTLQSVHIALGMLIAAVHHAGLVCLPYTPSRTDFLSEILNQPAYRRPTTILVVGYPADDAQVPALDRKPLDKVVSFV
jgi:nitroreductase